MNVKLKSVREIIRNCEKTKKWDKYIKKKKKCVRSMRFYSRKNILILSHWELLKNKNKFFEEEKNSYVNNKRCKL